MQIRHIAITAAAAWALAPAYPLAQAETPGRAVIAAAIDALLYLFVPKITVCYRCRAEYRHLPINPRHEGFELAIAEKYRQH